MEKKQCKGCLGDRHRMVGKGICLLVFGVGRQTGGCGEEGDTERGTQQTRLALRREVGEGGRQCRLGELGMAASLPGDGVALSVLVLSGMADDRSRKWGIWEKKALSAPTTDTGGVSSASISQCSSSKSGAIWTQSCPSYKLSAAPRDCSGSQDSLAHPRGSVPMARRADGTGSTTVPLHHLVSPARGALQSQVSLALGTALSLSPGRGHLSTLKPRWERSGWPRLVLAGCAVSGFVTRAAAQDG